MQKIDSLLLKKIVPIHRLPPADSNFVVYRLGNDECAITLTGTAHTKEYESKQIEALRNALKNWSKDKHSNRGVCLERVCPDDADNTIEKIAVEECGEAGLIEHFLSNNEITPVVVEPNFNDTVIPLAREITGDDLALGSWAVLNSLSSTCRDDSYTEIASGNLANVVEEISRQFPIADGYKIIKQHITRETGIQMPDMDAEPGTPIDTGAIMKAQEPADGPYSTNRAGAALNLARDYGMLEKILEEAKVRDGLFVWVGLNHALSILPALEHLGYKKTPS